MEGDFEGRLEDMQPDPDADDQEQDGEEEERLDQVATTVIMGGTSQCILIRSLSAMQSCCRKLHMVISSFSTFTNYVHKQ